MSEKKKNQFSHHPLTPEQREKRAQQIIAKAGVNTDEPLDKKKNNRQISARIPESLHRDIERIVELSGLTKNSVCIEIIRLGVREKLKDIENK